MDYQRKYTVATIVVAIAVGLAFWGFGHIQSEAFSGHITLFTKVVFFGSVVVGVIAAVCRTYWKRMRDQDDLGQRAAVEALAEVGRKKIDEKHLKQ